MNRTHRSLARSWLWLLILLLYCPAWGHSLVYEDAAGECLFTLSVPEGWSVALDGERVHLVSADTGEYIAVWRVNRIGDVKAGKTYIKTFLDSFLDDYELEPADATTFRGMTVLFQRGQGHRDGRAENFSFTLFEPKAGHLCFAVRLGRNDKNDTLIRDSLWPYTGNKR